MSVARDSSEPAWLDASARSILEALDEVAWVRDPAGRFVFANQAFLDSYGLARDEVVGRSAVDVFAAAAGARMIAEDAALLADGGKRDADETIEHRGRIHRHRTRRIVLRDRDGSAVGICGTARVMRELDGGAAVPVSSSGDHAHTLQEIARLALPELADFCIIDEYEEGQLRGLAAAHVDPVKRGLLATLRAEFPSTASSPSPAGRVIATRQPELIATITPDVIASHTKNPRHAELIRAIGMRSHIAVPLAVNDRILGVLSLGITESDRRYDERDLKFAVDLARTAALALDNARLYGLAREELANRASIAAALAVSESRFRAVFESSPLSTQVFDASGWTIRVNPAWEALWGISGDQIADYNILQDQQLVAQGLHALIRRAFAGTAVELPAIRYDTNQTLPARTKHPDAVRWVRAYAYPIIDAQGRVTEVVLVHEDVSERHAAEERVRASEERLRIALAAAQMNVWDWNLVTGRVECSENAQDFFGIAIGDASDFKRVVHPDDVSLLDDAVRAAITRDQPYEAEYRLRDPHGRTRWVTSRARVERDAGGVARHIIGVTVDVTARRAAEAATRILADAGTALGSSLDLTQMLSDLAHVVVPRFADWCAVDLLDDGALRRVAVLHPDPARVALARALFDRYPPRPGAARGVFHVIESQSHEWRAELTAEQLHALAFDEEHARMLVELELRSYICVPLVARGVSLGALTFVQADSHRQYGEPDVTLALELGRRVALAVDNATLYRRVRDDDRRKDEFLATLAHELRNPLAPIRSGLDILRLAPSPQIVQRTQDVMERQLNHMVKLIDDLLDLSRVTRGKIDLELETLDFTSVVHGALEVGRTLLVQAGVELTVRLPDEPVQVRGDRTRLLQILTNLLNNAAKFSPGGHVELVVRTTPGRVLVDVRDDGIGIAGDMLGRIFEMFVQGRSRGRGAGLGIGLTLVRRLAELHGGEVTATSGGEGLGSTFTLTLPTTTESSEPVARAEPSGTAQKSRRVLVVDDNLDAAELLSLNLTQRGHQVMTAASGPEALDRVRGTLFDIAFLDIGLPGMSGYELAEQIRTLPGGTAITLVALTGWGQPDDRRRSQVAGFDAHFTKPIDPRDLDAVLRG